MLKIDLYNENWNSVLAHHGHFPISRLSPFEYLIQLPQRLHPTQQTTLALKYIDVLNLNTTCVLHNNDLSTNYIR